MKKTRRSKKWTQEQAAEKAGISLRYWQQLESGEKNMTLKTVTRISKCLGIGIDALIA